LQGFALPQLSQRADQGIEPQIYFRAWAADVKANKPLPFGAIGVTAHDGDPIQLHQKSQKRIPRALYRDAQLNNYIPADQIEATVEALRWLEQWRQNEGPQW